MSSQAHANRLAHDLSSTGLVEPVNSTFTDNRVSVLLRVKMGVEQQWNTMIRNILLATDFFAKEAHAWNAHICRTYFLKQIKNEKKLVFGWSITITSQDMSTSIDEINRVLHGGNPEPTGDTPSETMEFPLVGPQKERNVPGQSGKGAYTIGGKSDFRPPVR
jgi:hypothetical protein